MTADLLDETIRITQRTLAEVEEKYPGIQQQISAVLLVGGSSRMPAVSAALQKEFGWDPSSPIRTWPWPRAQRSTRLARPSGMSRTRRVTAARAATDVGAGEAGAPGPVTEEAVRAVADQTGLAEDDVRRLAQRTVVNVLPKAIGVKLVDTSKPGWEETTSSRRSMWSTSWMRRRNCPSSGNPSSPAP